MAERRDAVDRKLEVWRRELPDLDFATEGLVERIQKLSRYLDRSLGETAAEYGLTIGDWHFLGALRAAGPPYRVTAGALAEQLGVTAGALTSRIDRLEERALVRRVPDSEDRRSTWVALTDEGRATWDAAVAVQARREQLVAAGLDERQKERLNDLLRRLMLAFEDEAGPPPARRELDDPAS
jgi:DNA-binding MarR family transcriptional regulator